jgi:aldose 1-epimerase
MKKSLFGKTSQNEDIYLYKLKNSNCIEVEIINYGCIITSIKIPDKNGNLIDIVLGYDNLNDYINDPFILVV